MEKKNRLDEVKLAEVSNSDLNQIKELEQELGDKYYIIAFEK